MQQCGEIIKKLRKEKGMTQLDEAKLIGVSIKTLYRYEQGLVKRYNPHTVNKFVEYYNVEISDIWKENDNEK